MASVLSFPAGRSFVYVFTKELVADVSKQWVNTYESISIASGELSDLIRLGRALIEWEERIHGAGVRLVKWSVRTGARDSQPYDPNTFYEEPINLTGGSGHDVGNPVDLSVALWADRAVVTGRAGRLFIRGVLFETDIQADAGRFTLSPVARAAFNTAFTNGLGWIAPFLSGGNDATLRLIMIGPNGQFPRPVLQFSVNGVSIVKKFHSYFDRGSLGSPPPEYVEPSAEDVAAAELIGDNAGLTFVPAEEEVPPEWPE